MNQMDQHLKERLVGAAVLVALGMLVIPSLLDGPPPDQPVRVGLELPTPEDARSAHTIRLDVPPARPATPGSGSIVRPSEPEEEPNRRPPADAGTPPADEAKTAPAEKPAALPPAPPTPATTEETPPQGGWGVQVGSFSNADNARKLARELRGEGYEVSVSRVDAGGQTMHRVRVRAGSDRESAEAMAARLRDGGYPGRVVADPG